MGPVYAGMTRPSMAIAKVEQSDSGHSEKFKRESSVNDEINVSPNKGNVEFDLTLTQQLLPLVDLI